MAILKYLIGRWTGVEVVLVAIGVPLLLLFYYRGKFAGTLGTFISVATEYIIFMHPLGAPWHNKRFLTMLGFMCLVYPIAIFYVPRWRAQLDYQRKLNLVLLEAAKYRDLLLGTLGHDLRTPLTAMKSSTYLLRRRAPQHIETIDRIERGCNRMTNMVDQILDMTAIHLGSGIVLYLSRVELYELAQHAAEEVQLAYPQAIIQVRCDKSHIVGQWDSIRIFRTLINLFTNACKYGDISRPITVTLEEKEKLVIISVHNYGEPIPPELKPMLFNPFKRGSIAEAKVKGLGLGLYITAEMIDKHGGSIDVQSSKKDGTTFTVTLPR